MKFQVGDIVHGFAGGAFGRDSYGCRRVEAVGRDWVVARNERGEAEATTKRIVDPNDRSYCSETCEFWDSPVES